jgi:NAD(P)H dehydrogenase (quinone)
MQILVMYYSRSGNTEALAQEVVKGVESVDGVDAVLKPVGEVTAEDFTACDGIIAGSPVYFGTMAWPMKEVFDKLVGVRKKMGDKIGAAFATAGDPSGGKETTILSIHQAMLIYGMIIVGDPLAASGHYGVSCVAGPDERARDHAVLLGKRVAELAKKVRG